MKNMGLCLSSIMSKKNYFNQFLGANSNQKLVKIHIPSRIFNMFAIQILPANLSRRASLMKSYETMFC